MVKTAEQPEGLRPFLFHGLELSSSGEEHLADCPFCGRESKFSVNENTTLWKCLVCGESGNSQSFLEQLWKSCSSDIDYSALAKERGLAPKTLKEWGVRKSPITEEWLVPGFNEKKKVVQLYRWTYSSAKDKYLLLTTPTLGHGMFGVGKFSTKKEIVYVCEGPWDGMKLWESLRSHKDHEGLIVSSTKLKGSLSEDINVLSVPGCNTFKSSWTSLFKGRKASFFFDNDYPKKHPKTGKKIEPAGLQGIKSISSKLSDSCDALGYLSWGPQGYTKQLPAGTDVRDFLANGSLKNLIAKIQEVPPSWIEQQKEKKNEKKPLDPIPCSSWRVLTNKWRKAMKWGKELDTTLSVMLASSISTEAAGEQLWLKVIGPASSGKSTLSEALTVSKPYVVAKDTFTGLTSGYQAEGENLSFVELLRNKTLIVNDGDTLLQMPNVATVLSELRTFYGRNIRTQYKNAMSMDFENIATTVIICGTGSLRALDTSELGERFLDCVIMDGIDSDLEDEILLRVVDRENTSIDLSGQESQSFKDPKMQEAMQYTGGYVNYLRECAFDLLKQVSIPQEYRVKIARIAKLVAIMRARPSKVQSEGSEREFAARLASQFTRLAKCLTAVLGRKRVNEDVMDRCLKVAKDTARGSVLDLCNLLHSEGACEVKYISLMTNRKDVDISTLLRFLREIEVVQQSKVIKSKRLNRKPKWELTPMATKLLDDIENL